MTLPVAIAGAGPAGLAAAITLATHGGRAVVYDRAPNVGTRVHGDFQGNRELDDGGRRSRRAAVDSNGGVL
jgi:flavin-dependent dehydrogenase